MVAVLRQDEGLSSFELAFVQAVLDYRGVRGAATADELRGALETITLYAQQVEDNPQNDGAGDWLAGLPDDSRGEMAARAFLDYGVTKPTAEQLYRVQCRLYGPALCATCD